MAIISLVLRGIDNASPALKRVGASVGELNQKLDVSGKLAGALQTSMIAVGAATAAALVGAVKQAIDFQESLSGLNKIVGVSEVQAAGLDDALIKLTRTLPNTASELAAIAASGAQLGVATADLEAFTSLASRMGVAFDLPAEQAGQAMATLSNVMGIPIKEFQKVGDVVNFLADSTNADAADMVNALTRVGGTMKSFGLEYNESAALVSAFLSVGAAPEIAATSVASMLPALQAATLGTDRFKSGLEMIGLSAEQMEANIESGPAEAITDLFKRLESLTNSDRTKAIALMFGQGSDARNITSLAENTQILSDALQRVGDEAAYAGSMNREFDVRAGTVLNKFKLMRNAVNEVLLLIGTPLLGPLASAIDAATRPLHALADFLSANPLPSLPGKLGIDTSSLQSILDGGITAMGMAIAHIQPFLSDAMLRLGNAVPTLFTELGAAIPPIMSRLGTAIAGMLNNANWGAIGQGITNFLKATSSAFVGVFNSLVQTTRDVTRTVDWHAIGVQAGVVAGRLVGMAAEALSRIDWGSVIGSLQSASVAVARMLAGAIGGFAIGVLPGLGRAALNVLNATGTTIAASIHEGITGMVGAVVDGVRAFMASVRETVMGAIAILRNPGQLLRSVGNLALSATATPAPVSPSPSIYSNAGTPAPPSPANMPLANTIGSRADGQLGNLLSAAMTETRRKPPGSDLVVANTSETILPANTAIATPAGRPMANIVLNINGAGQDAKAIAREAVALLQRQFEAEVQGRLA